MISFWNRYWFSPRKPGDLCVARIFFYLLLYFFLRDRIQDLARWGNLPDAGLWTSISFFKYLPFHALSPSVLHSLGILWQVAVIFSALGLFTRLSTKLVFFLGLYVIGLPYNFGKIDHPYHLPLVIAGIFAFSRCGDFWSVDRLIANWRKKASFQIPSVADAAYQWPLMLARTYMMVIYFEAGFQKLKHSGLEWVFSDNFQLMLVTRPTVTPLGLWVSYFPWLCQFLAGVTLLAQILAPLALFSGTAALFLVPTLFMFHIGTYILMGNHGYFIPYDIAYVAWVPWGLLISRLDRRSKTSYPSSYESTKAPEASVPH